MQLHSAKARAKLRLQRAKDEKQDQIELAKFPAAVRAKLEKMHAAMMSKKLKIDEKRALSDVVRKEKQVSQLTKKILASKAKLKKISGKQDGSLLETTYENTVSPQEQLRDLRGEVARMEAIMHLQTLTLLKQERL